MKIRIAGHMAKLLAFACVFLFLGLPQGFAQEATKMAYVDLQKALNEVADGKSAKEKLKKEFDAKQKQLDKKQEDVKKLKEDLEAQAMMLSEDARRERAMDLQKKMYELQQLYIQLQGDLSKKEAEATKKIFEKMGKIIEDLGKEKGYDMILERSESSILYAKPGLDLTDELVRRYNSKK